MKVFGHKIIIFGNINLHRPLLIMVQDCGMWHNRKLPHGILIIFWKF
jgi:hypothetical protein